MAVSFHERQRSCIITRPRVLTPAPRTMARITQSPQCIRGNHKNLAPIHKTNWSTAVSYLGKWQRTAQCVEAPCNLPVPILVLVRDAAVNWSLGRPWKNARREMCTSSGAKAAVTLIPLPLEKMTGLGNHVATNLRSLVQKSRTANTRPEFSTLPTLWLRRGVLL